METNNHFPTQGQVILCENLIDGALKTRAHPYIFYQHMMETCGHIPDRGHETLGERKKI